MDNLNKINGDKDLYDRICGWMAEMDDMQEEPTAWETGSGKYMLDQAMQIMYDIYQTCGDESKDDVEGVPV